MRQNNRTVIDISQDPGLHRIPIKQAITPPPVSVPKFHWVPDKVDPRDYKYAVTNKVQSNKVDLRIYCSSIENQGNLGSCTGQAVAGAIELLYKRENKFKDVSRLYIYYYERLLMGTVNYDSGAYIRDGIKATSKYGASLENLWPYDISKFRNKPSNNAITDGSRRKVTLYQRIDNHAGCLDAIANGYPVIIGFHVYDSFMSNTVTRTGIMPYPNKRTERLLGGHAVLLVGYDKTTNRYIARNSWGTAWGDGGYFYMPFQVIQDTTMSSDFWIIKAASNP